MKDNYLMFNGQKIEFTAEQLDTSKKCLGNKKKLSEVMVGDTVKIGEWEFVVLEHGKDTTALVMKGLYKSEVKFGNSNNDYRESNIKSLLDKLADKLCEFAGEKNVIEHTIDLTSDDGLKDYGTVKARVSLLTSELYRRYVQTIDKYKLDAWWWLITPHSTPAHDNALWVKCVSPVGGINGGGYDGNGGVRPFCILKSDIFVS